MTKKKKKNCRSFINTSDNPQGDINQSDIIDFNIDKVIKELKDSLNCNIGTKQLKYYFKFMEMTDIDLFYIKKTLEFYIKT